MGRSDGAGQDSDTGMTRIQREVLPELIDALLELSAAEGALGLGPEAIRARLRGAAAAVDGAVRRLRELVVDDEADMTQVTVSGSGETGVVSGGESGGGVSGGGTGGGVTGTRTGGDVTDTGAAFVVGDAGGTSAATEPSRTYVATECPGRVPLTDVLEQVLTVGRRGGAEVSIDVQDVLAIRGEVDRADVTFLTGMASRAVREVGGRRRRTTPLLELRIAGGTLEVLTVDRAAAQDEVRFTVTGPVSNA